MNHIRALIHADRIAADLRSLREINVRHLQGRPRVTDPDFRDELHETVAARLRTLTEMLDSEISAKP